MDTEIYRQAVRAVDIDALLTQFSADPTVHVPSRRAPFKGHDEVRAILQVALGQFEDLDFTAEFAKENGYVLQFTARIGLEAARGVNILELVDDKIVELTVMVQPYTADHSLRELMMLALEETA